MELQSKGKRLKAFAEEEDIDNLLGTQSGRLMLKGLRITANIINPLHYILFTIFYFIVYNV